MVPTSKLNNDNHISNIAVVDKKKINIKVFFVAMSQWILISNYCIDSLKLPEGLVFI